MKKVLLGFVLLALLSIIVPANAVGQTPSDKTRLATVILSPEDLPVMRAVFTQLLDSIKPTTTQQDLEAILSSAITAPKTLIYGSWTYHLRGDDFVHYSNFVEPKGKGFDIASMNNPNYDIEETSCITLADILADVRASGWQNIQTSVDWSKHGFFAEKEGLKLSVFAGGGGGERVYSSGEGKAISALLDGKGCVYEFRLHSWTSA